ncbi:MAG TPA: hypothetical protein DDW78_08025 [Treponema sp.]|nr:hypothetical protein [Treponema sp.]
MLISVSQDIFMALTFIVLLYIVNIILWIVLFSRIKKMFSTENLVRKIVATANDVVKSIDAVTDRNRSLVKDGEERLMAVSAETARRVEELKAELEKADKHIMFLKGELDKTEKAFAFRAELDAAGQQQAKQLRASVQAGSPASVYRHEQLQGTRFSAAIRTENVDGDSIAVGSMPDAEAAPQQPVVMREAGQPLPPQEHPPVPPEPAAPAESQNAAAAPRQPQAPQIIVSAAPLRPRKDYKQQVKELSALGMTAEEIAAELGRSPQEVEVTLELL